MSKYHKIRWTSDDNKELARVVRNYNAKVKRLTENPSKLRNSIIDSLGITNESIKNALPEMTSVKQLKELIHTRQDLKRELNSLRRFSKRGSENITVIPDTKYNIITTKWQKKEMNRSVAMINRRRKNRLEKLKETELTSRGKDLGYTLGDIGMGRIEEISLKPMNAFTRGMNQRDLKWKWKSIMQERQSDYFTRKDYQVRDNYLKGLKENYNFEAIKDVYEHIQKIDISEFLKVFNREGATFEWVSPGGKLDLEEDEYDGFEKAIREIWLPGSSENSESIIMEETTKIPKKQTKKKQKKKTKKRG